MMAIHRASDLRRCRHAQHPGLNPLEVLQTKVFPVLSLLFQLLCRNDPRSFRILPVALVCNADVKSLTADKNDLFNFVKSRTPFDWFECWDWFSFGLLASYFVKYGP